MKHTIELLNAKWAGKRVLVNNNTPNFVAGKIIKLEWVLDNETYINGPKVGIQFTDDSDVDYQVFDVETLSIELDSRYTN